MRHTVTSIKVKRQARGQHGPTTSVSYTLPTNALWVAASEWNVRLKDRAESFIQSALTKSGVYKRKQHPHWITNINSGGRHFLLITTRCGEKIWLATFPHMFFSTDQLPVLTGLEGKRERKRNRVKLVKRDKRGKSKWQRQSHKPGVIQKYEKLGVKGVESQTGIKNIALQEISCKSYAVNKTAREDTR